MGPKSKRRRLEEGEDKPTVPHVRYIPQESRYGGLPMVEIASCLGCGMTFPAMKIIGDDPVPIPGYFHHCFECPQRETVSVTCDDCWSMFLDEQQYDTHLPECSLVAERNKNVYKVPCNLGNSTDGLVLQSDLNPGSRTSLEDDEPYEICVPHVPEDVPFDKIIKCPGCSESFPAASTPIDSPQLHTQGFVNPGQLIGNTQYYRHCGILCSQYKSLNLMTCCLKCLKMYINSTELNAHKPECDLICSQNDAQCINCVRCDSIVINDQSLKTHYQKKHGSSKLYECPSCDKLFQKRVDLTKHEIEEHDLVTCGTWTQDQFNGRVFSRQSVPESSDGHQANVSEQNELVPPTAKESTKKKESGKSLTSVQVIPRLPASAPLTASARSGSSRRRPLADVHRPQLANVRSSSNGHRPSSAQSNHGDDFICDECPIKFSKSIHLRHHKSNVHQCPSIRCPTCHKTFRTIDSYMEHDHVTEDNRIVYFAFSCPSSTPISDLKVSSESGPHYEQYFLKSNNCSICNQWFKDPCDQRAHFLSFHVGTRFRCPFCRVSFRTIDEIESHCQRSHNSDGSVTNPAPHFLVFK